MASPMTERAWPLRKAGRPSRSSPRLADAALRELYDTHGPALLNYLLGLTRGDRHRAEDILQETLLRAWRNLGILACDIRAVHAWLYTVARNIAIDQIRAQRCRPLELGDARLDERPDEDNPVERILDVADVHSALASLSHRAREVLIEVYFREKSVTEVAATLGIPPGTVKSRTFYALRSMRRALEGHRLAAPRRRERDPAARRR